MEKAYPQGRRLIDSAVTAASIPGKRTDEFHLPTPATERQCPLAQLAAVWPDGGLVQFTMQCAVDAYTATQALLLPELYGVVAERHGTPGLVGAANVSFGPFMFGAEERPCALLSNLMVHPDYHRQGIAHALTGWRLQKVHECLGENAIVFANSQSGNGASLANANHWCERLIGPLVTAAFPPLTRCPRLPQTITIRAAEAHEFPAIANHLNTFYRDYNVYQFQTPETLAAWLAWAPGGNPIHRCSIAADERGNLLAGASVVERHPIVQLRITKVPLPIQLITQALGIMPRDKILRELEVKRLWYRPGPSSRCSRFMAGAALGMDIDGELHSGYVRPPIASSRYRSSGTRDATDDGDARRQGIGRSGHDTVS